MSYEVVTIPPFEKQLKRLAKKYPSLKSEFSDLIERLELNPLSTFKKNLVLRLQ